MDAELQGKIVAKIRESYDGELKSMKAASGDEFIVTAPTRAQFLRFMEMGNDVKRAPKALEALFRSCVVYPAEKELNDLLDRKPGICIPIGEKLVEWAGAEKDVEEKKL